VSAEAAGGSGGTPADAIRSCGSPGAMRYRWLAETGVSAAGSSRA
jgi:hypothetical protein